MISPQGGGGYPRPAQEPNEPKGPLTTGEHHQTFDRICGFFARRFQRDDLVFQVEGEISDLLPDGHGVDHVFIRLCPGFVCHVVELDVFYPCVRVRLGGRTWGLYTLDDRPICCIKVETPGFPARGCNCKWVLKLTIDGSDNVPKACQFSCTFLPRFCRVGAESWGRRLLVLWGATKEIGIDSNFHLYFISCVILIGKTSFETPLKKQKLKFAIVISLFPH